MELTIEQIKEKYSDIENKIPEKWETYEKAGIELAQDLLYHWDISDFELIRIISLIDNYTKGLCLYKHINPMYSYLGLYPHVMKKFDIKPDKND